MVAALFWGGSSEIKEDKEASPIQKTVEVAQVESEYGERIQALEDNVLLLRESAEETKAILLELRNYQGNTTKKPDLKSAFTKEQLQDMQYERQHLGTEDDPPYGISVTGKYKNKEEALESLGFSIKPDSFDLIGQEFIEDG